VRTGGRCSHFGVGSWAAWFGYAILIALAIAQLLLLLLFGFRAYYRDDHAERY